MYEVFARIFLRLPWKLGGRPMRYDGPAFYDYIGNIRVGNYTDTLGRRWLASGPWALFRVPKPPAPTSSEAPR